MLIKFFQGNLQIHPLFPFHPVGILIHLLTWSLRSISCLVFDRELVLDY